MRIESDTKLDFKDVLIKPKRSTLSSRGEVDITRNFKFKHSPYTWTGCPIISANMDTTGIISIAQSLEKEKMLTCLHKFYTVEDLKSIDSYIKSYKDSVAITCGSNPSDYERLREIVNYLKQVKFICLDVANGYSERFIEFVSQVRNDYPEKVIIAGNVCTAEMTEALILAGADIIKVGIGPGAACTTRITAGVGVPQFSAIVECADAAHGLGGHIIGDGGCTTPGDVAKAFGAGADFVMLGSMFSGHDESGGEVIEDGNGNKYKEFYGMSSKKANEKYNGGLAKHRASEGRYIKVPYRGPLENTLQQITGGLRSACTYVGASRIKDLPKCTTFVKVNTTHNTIFEKYTIDS
jgi:GMP reductase